MTSYDKEAQRLVRNLKRAEREGLDKSDPALFRQYRQHVDAFLKEYAIVQRLEDQGTIPAYEPPGPPDDRSRAARRVDEAHEQSVKHLVQQTLSDAGYAS